MGKLLDLAKTDVNSSVSRFSPKHRTSVSPSFVYPIHFDLLPLRSKIKFDFSAIINSFSTVRPVFGKYDVRYNVYVQDLSAYSYDLSRNGEVIGYDGSLSSSDYFDTTTGLFSRLPVRSVLPNMTTSEESALLVRSNISALGQTPGSIYRIWSVNPSSLDCYLGLPGNYIPFGGNDGLYKPNGKPNNSILYYQKSGVFELMYLDIIRNYHINRQFGYAPFAGWIKKVNNQDNTIVMSPGYVWCPIKQIDDFFEDVYKGQADADSFYDITTSANYPYKSLFGPSGTAQSIMHCHHAVPHGKLFLSCYNPDINNSWLSTQNYSNMTRLATVNTSGTSVLYQTIIGVSHQQKFLQKLFLSGGLMSDWLYAEYGTYGRDSCPRLIHSSKDEFVFDDVISRSSTEGADLGERGGIGYGGGFGSVPAISTGNRYLAVMITMTLTPNVDYFQGVDHRLNVTDLGRFPMPDFDNISMEPRFYEQLNALPFIRQDGFQDEGYYVDRPTRADYLALTDNASFVFPAKANYAVGYQTPYSAWKTEVNRVTGSLCDDMRDWVFLRDFQFAKSAPWATNDNNLGSFMQLNTFPYIFPEEYQYVFNSGQTSEGVALDNFQVNFKIVKGKKVLPVRKGLLPKVV